VTFHLILRRRFSKYDEERRQESKLGSAYLMIIRVVFVAWLAASATGLVVAYKHTICERHTLDTRPWKSVDSCKLQQAIVAMSLLSM